MKLIVGLGNPDKEHMNTRHNFGWLMADALLGKKELSWKNHKQSNSLIADFKIGREKILLAKPLTFMNLSGVAVKALKQFYKIDSHQVIVIHDDIDLPFNTIRLSRDKNAGGHKGVESIIQHLKSKKFTRIRLGIGPQKGSAEDFVLKKFSTEEKSKISEIIDTSHLILESLLDKGFTATANKYN